VHSRLFYILSDACHKTVSVLEIGVEVCLVHDGAWLGLYAGLLIWQGKLVQHVDVRQCVAQSDLVGGHRVALVLSSGRQDTAKLGRLNVLRKRQVVPLRYLHILRAHHDVISGSSDLPFGITNEIVERRRGRRFRVSHH